MKRGESRAQSNRRIRQEALREQLRDKGLAQQVIESAEKLCDFSKTLDALQVQRLKAANEARLKLLNKILPDEKYLEVAPAVGDDGEVLKWTFEVVGVK